MRFSAVLIAAGLLFGAPQTGWCWLFGSDDDEPRLSKLMEPASELIDEASDLASDGKVQEAVEKYRAALVELDKVEREHPKRAETPEFATLRNKRAYVNAAIDSMLLSQVRDNAKAVAVSDTAELEEKLRLERERKSGKTEEKKPETEKKETEAEGESESDEKKETVEKPVKPVPDAPKAEGRRSLRAMAIEDISNGDYASAELSIREWLAESPDNPAALNLKAVMEARQGRVKEAEITLDRAIMSHPRNHCAYYNMANLMLQMGAGGKSAARRYYDTGRSVGGPVDTALEEALK